MTSEQSWLLHRTFNPEDNIHGGFESHRGHEIYGVISSVGRALDCGSKGRRFEPDITPKMHTKETLGLRWPREVTVGNAMTVVRDSGM